MVRVKICGITNIEDALLAVGLGADALGFVFAPSPRKISPEVAREIIEALPPFVSRVGVFVNQVRDKVEKIAHLCNLDVLQLHGEESSAYCKAFELKVIKALRVKDSSVLDVMSKYEVDAFLLDTFVGDKHGGTGKTFNWKIAGEAKSFGEVILSGGLTPKNIDEAIVDVEPYGVDVSSGVEAYPGKKDPEKLRAFFNAVRQHC